MPGQQLFAHLLHHLWILLGQVRRLSTILGQIIELRQAAIILTEEFPISLAHRAVVVIVTPHTRPIAAPQPIFAAWRASGCLGVEVLPLLIEEFDRLVHHGLVLHVRPAARHVDRRRDIEMMVQSLLKGAIFGRMQRSSNCRREMYVGAQFGEVTVWGYVDAVFVNPDATLTLVDFKTDIEIASAQDAYKQQVALYVEAVRRATGRPATGVLLKV